MIWTDRLILRPYEPRDRAALWVQLRDPEVMQYLLPVADDAAFDLMLERMAGYSRDFGFTFWMVERRADGMVIGVCGLKPGGIGTPIDGRTEIGWRLARAAWGQGYAREAAEAVLEWAWAKTNTPRVVAITVPANAASWGLMERLGMSRVADGDFDHPEVADDSPLKRHILYAIERPTR